MTDKSTQIAVITNEPERAEMIETTSNLFGWGVEANSGHMQPLNWLLAQSVDVALVDIDIPNAIQLVTDIVKAVPQLPLLVLVAPERFVDLQPHILAGAQDFVALPLNPKHYRAVIERALSSTQLIPTKQSVNVNTVDEMFGMSNGHQEEKALPEHEAALLYSTNGREHSTNGNGRAHSAVAMERVSQNSVQADQTVDDLSDLGEQEDISQDEALDFDEPLPSASFTSPQELTNSEAVVEIEQEQFVESLPEAEEWLTNDAITDDVYNYVENEMSEPHPAEARDRDVHLETEFPDDAFGNHQPHEAANAHRMPENIINATLDSGSMPSDGSMSATALVRANHFNNGHQIPPVVPPVVPPSVPSPSTSNARRMIAVVGLRGGVGRSTVAANLALTLQKNDLGNVALVEAHHNLSHLSLMLHLHPRNTLAGLAEANSLDFDIIQGYLQSHGSGIKVLSAPSHLDDLVELSSNQWAATLEMTWELSPLVVVDTGSTVDAALLEVLVLATDIIVVMNPEIASLRGTTALVNSLYTESEVQGNVHVVLNRSGVGGGLDEGTIRKQLGHELSAILPDDPGLATYAMNRGVPFVHSHSRSLLTKRVKALADKIVLGESATTETKLSARSLIPFLSSFG